MFFGTGPFELANHVKPTANLDATAQKKGSLWTEASEIMSKMKEWIRRKVTCEESRTCHTYSLGCKGNWASDHCLQQEWEAEITAVTPRLGECDVKRCFPLGIWEAAWLQEPPLVSTPSQHLKNSCFRDGGRSSAVRSQCLAWASMSTRGEKKKERVDGD
jgi:hypothetical protein